MAFTSRFLNDLFPRYEFEGRWDAKASTAVIA
jgi:hypothetical protein